MQDAGISVKYRVRLNVLIDTLDVISETIFPPHLVYINFYHPKAKFHHLKAQVIRTKRYCSFINYALSHYQTKITN